MSHSTRPHKIQAVSHGLELDEDITLHNRGWRVHKAGLAAMYLLLLLAALGLFGNGPLSYRTQDENGLQLKYEYFLRRDAETELTLSLPDAKGRISISLPQRYADKIAIRDIVPMPEQTYFRNGNMVYVFPASGQAQLSIRISPRKAGRIRSAIAVNGTLFHIAHFIYP